MCNEQLTHSVPQIRRFVFRECQYKFGMYVFRRILDALHFWHSKPGETAQAVYVVVSELMGNFIFGFVCVKNIKALLAMNTLMARLLFYEDNIAKVTKYIERFDSLSKRIRDCKASDWHSQLDADYSKHVKIFLCNCILGECILQMHT